MTSGIDINDALTRASTAIDKAISITADLEKHVPPTYAITPGGIVSINGMRYRIVVLEWTLEPLGHY